MLPRLHSASSRPEAGGDPACSASDGSPTSIAPSAVPISATGPSSARNPGLESAGTRSYSEPFDVDDERTNGERRNSEVPTMHTTPSIATAASGEVTAITNATTSGPEIQTVSWRIESSA